MTAVIRFFLILAIIPLVKSQNVFETDLFIDHDSVAPRILGGEDVKNRSEFPYLVSVLREGKPLFLGVLVSCSHVITSASLLVYKKSYIPYPTHTFKVVAGSSFVTPTCDSIIMDVKKCVFQDAFDPLIIWHAFGILILKNRFSKWTINVKPLSLEYIANSAVAPGIECIVPGFKSKDVTSTRDDTQNLVKARTVPISHKECDIRYLKEDTFCLRPVINLSRPCLGDLGAPVICNGYVHAIILAISRPINASNTCNRNSVAGNISYHRKWIIETVIATSGCSALKIAEYAIKTDLIYYVVLYLLIKL